MAATVVDADYTGSANGTLTIAKANQTISFDPVPGVTYGAAPFTVNATAGSGLAVTFSIVSGPATITGNIVTVTGAGVVVIRASQGGDANHNPAPDVDQQFTVSKASQVITFATLADKTYGNAPFTVTATASSGLPVSFSVVSGPATVAGNTVTLTGAGTVVLRASQSGSPDYAAADPVDQSFSVAKALATVTLGTLNFVYDGTPKHATATTSPAGLTVNFTYNGGGTAPISVGSYAVVATINDPNYQGSANGTLVISDGTPPAIRSLAASPAVLWPPNHKMVRVVIAADVVDDVDPAPTTRIIAVSCNQPVNGTGDGNTSPDWELTGALTLNLRAERSGNDGDRIYTITIESRDYSNNVSTRTVTVTVPHNR